ncbi:hypothetical protein [Oceanisphaera sp. IT1-181]|uniref:hypothetical protein n=1 Tax=Oceanisphaera sp. IT1-181 TaxID=3081199 RepID=UPI0029C9DEAD|nr:hypothetical protein [Oceanisphaera sp. IT1-181]
MSLFEQLNRLDSKLLAEFADPELLQAETIEQRLAERAQLLQQLMQKLMQRAEQSAADSVDTDMLNAELAAELIERSQHLMQQAEQCRTLLAEKLATLQKGRRSTRAYGDVKKNNQE